jgi:hypothetical protein
MTPNQYNFLVGTCDEILNRNKDSISRIAISWLHVIRPHPIFINKYEYLFQDDFLFYLNLKFVFLRFIRVSSLIKNILLATYHSLKIGKVKINKAKSELDVLFVSHLVGKLDDYQYGDLYFGEIPKILHEAGYKVSVLLINHTKKNLHPEVTRQLNGVNIYVLPKYLDILAEFKILWRLLKESVNLLVEGNKEKNQLKRKIYHGASVEALSTASVNTFRIGLQVAAYASRVSSKNVITTCEGHGWERLVYGMVHEINPELRCLGYVHAPMFYGQHSMFQNFLEKCNADCILTIGNIQKKIIEKKSLPHLKVENIGSSKFFLNEKIRKKFRSCLVIPEGIESECVFLFQFSVQCAIDNPEMSFIWRLHPLISFDSLKKFGLNINSLPKNIQISNLSLEVDINRSDVALYRGTSAIIQAVIGGLVPIYVAKKNEISVDPFFEISNLIEKVYTPSDFSRCVNFKLPGQELALSNKVQHYANNFFSSIDLKLLISIIKNKL